MFKRIAFPVALAFGLSCTAIAIAQTGKMEFGDAMKVMTKCNVDQLRSMFTGNPMGQLDPGSAVATANTRNVDPSTVHDTDGTPLLVAAAATDCVEGVHVLLLSGADVTDTDKQGRTALHAAAASSNANMVQLLVQYKADVNAKTAAGDTPLSLAKTNEYKGKTDQRDKIVKFLTSKGAKDKS